jgi:2-oxoglutarate dehydrogenase E2 component (dihydrolipoamide succinyltransferase)
MPANIVVPEVGESIVDARVAKWLRKEGDVVSAGDPLVELETDKVDSRSARRRLACSRGSIEGRHRCESREVLGVIDEAAAGKAAPTAAPAPAQAKRPAAEPNPPMARRDRRARRPPRAKRPRNTRSTWQKSRAPATVGA